jgi:hypothetical protein
VIFSFERTEGKNKKIKETSKLSTSEEILINSGIMWCGCAFKYE